MSKYNYSIIKKLYEREVKDTKCWLLHTLIEDRIRYEKANHDVLCKIFEYRDLIITYNELKKTQIHTEQEDLKTAISRTTVSGNKLITCFGLFELAELKNTRREIYDRCVENYVEIKGRINSLFTDTDLKYLVLILELNIPKTNNKYFNEQEELKNAVFKWFDVGDLNLAEKYENEIIEYGNQYGTKEKSKTLLYKVKDSNE